MRDYDTDYGYADAVNRRARLALLIIGAVVFGVAWAGGAWEDNEPSPPVSVLSAEATLPPGPARISIQVPDRTTVPAAEQDSPASTGTTPTVPATAITPTSITIPAPTTTTTRPRPTATTPPPASTTTTTTTTTTIPPTTTTIAPTTTTTTTTTTIAPTTTTTAIPPTTTTVVAIGTIHIHELMGTARGDDDDSFARIEVRVKNDDGKDQRGVLVTGRFGSGSVRVVAGTTGGRGAVVFESEVVDADSITFTVTNLEHPDYQYEPADNRHSPSVTVEFD